MLSQIHNQHTRFSLYNYGVEDVHLFREKALRKFRGGRVLRNFFHLAHKKLKFKDMVYFMLHDHIRLQSHPYNHAPILPF